MPRWIGKAIRRGSRPPAPEPQCSFCGKRRRDVTKIIAGPGVFICDQCIGLCNEILVEDRTTLLPHQAVDDVTLREQLTLAGQQMRITEQHVRGAVAELRRRGMSWAHIGDALGISRQSAWERFSGED